MRQTIPRSLTPQIVMLADRVDLIATLAACFRRQWPDYYAGCSAADIEQDFRREGNRMVLPVRLLALDRGGALAGTVVLRERALQTRRDLTPGIGGLFVVEHSRRRGVGSALVSAAVATARGMNCPVVYTVTGTAGPLFERLGWDRTGDVLHDEQRLAIYRYRIAGPPVA